MKKVFIRTFGCQMNEYDSEKMLAVLAEENGGIEQVTEADEADIILFNTCSVREKAQEKVFSDLGRVRPLKEKNPDLIIGVAGCVASQEGENIIKRAPYVDVVFGPQTLHRLPKMIVDKETSGLSQVDISFPEIEKFDHLPPARVEGGAAFVSIMEGCSKYCSFCVVPYTRGEEFSRPLNDVLTEIANLTQQGVKEINLLGQNVNAYRGEMDNGEICDFATLLRIVHEIPGIERMRFTTSHPREFTDSIIECYRDLPKLVSHLHLPIQSGSDRVLSAMKRGYTALEYKSIIRKLRAIQIWSLRVLASCGMKLETFGTLPQEGQAQLLISNHISWLDIMAVNGAFPGRFVAKDDVAKWPVVGYLATQAQTVYVSRNKGTKGNTAKIATVTEALKNGDTVTIFPEGTSTEGYEILPFKPSFFQTAYDAGVSIIPMLCRYPNPDGTSPNLQAAYVGDTSLWQSICMIISQPSSKVELHFLEPVPAKEDRYETALEIHGILSRKLKELG